MPPAVRFNTDAGEVAVSAERAAPPFVELHVAVYLETGDPPESPGVKLTVAVVPLRVTAAPVGALGVPIHFCTRWFSVSAM